MKPHENPSTDPVSSSSSSSSAIATAAASAVRDLRQGATAVPSRDGTPSPSGGLGGMESVVVERRGEHVAECRWTVSQFPHTKARALWSRYFEVGGYDCRLLIYPKGDSQALLGYLSIYLQIVDPRGSSSSKWDCFSSYRQAVVHPADDSKSTRDS